MTRQRSFRVAAGAWYGGCRWAVCVNAAVIIVTTALSGACLAAPADGARRNGHGTGTDPYRQGAYTTALYTLADGSSACVLLMRPHPEGKGSTRAYDISIWRQSHSSHIWLARHGGSLPAVRSVPVRAGRAELTRLTVSKHLHPSTGVDAIMMDITGIALESRLAAAAASGAAVELDVGSVLFSLPKTGLLEALGRVGRCHLE